jgi:hypothetical protein
MKKSELSKLKDEKHPRNTYFIDEIHVSLTFLTNSLSFINKRNIW